MTDDWQTRAKQRTRRIYMTTAGLFAVGAVAGFMIGFFEDEERGLVAANSIPAEVAIIATVIFVIAVTFGTLRLMKATDELERRINANATVMAGNVLLIGYPAWFFLWKGGLVPEPDAMWLFCAGIVASILTYGWYKLR
jgi:Na+/melibiose symporter-like transporter